MEMVSKRERQVYQWSQENVCPLPFWNSASEFDHLPTSIGGTVNQKFSFD